MKFELIPLCEEHKQQFKTDMQVSFQQGAVDGLAKWRKKYYLKAI